jgi:hypothetical protein
MDNSSMLQTQDNNTFEEAIAQEAKNKHKTTKWEKLPKYTQWKLFKSYMHTNNITDGNLFKRMKSLISEKKTDAFVIYDVGQQEITNVDFKHEIFIRERSKKNKLKVQLAQAKEEEKIKSLEAAIEGISLSNNIEVIQEEHCLIESD